MNEEEHVLNKTILDAGIAKPISVTKEEAISLAKQAEEIEKNKAAQNSPRENIADAIPITKEELDENRVNEINDLMKNDYVKIVESRYSKKTYIILILILIVVVGIIIFELIHFGGKMS